jgi:NAD(P)-dependent dehydrogenase (short-subunit alcohol dehydrogenase family)
MNDSSKRIALVTGANKGIGLEIARRLGQAGVRVLVGARDAERGAAAVDQLKAEGLDAAFVRIDLGDEASIAAAAAKIADDHGRLDILVNNAGIVNQNDGPPSTASVAAVRQIFETNFFGTLAATQAMLPLLRKSSAGRIVNLSSSLGSLSINGDRSSPFYSARLAGYNASKAALNMLTVQLSEELRDSKVVVNSVSPGFAKTDLTGGQGFITAADAAIAPVRFALFDDAGVVSGKFVNVDGEIPW